MEDYYKILGVDRNASQEEIKTAYRKLAAKHHPDRGGDTAKFQEIQAAYDVLGDPEKRSDYNNPKPTHNNFSGVPPGFEDIISQMFGQHSPFGDIFGRRQQHARNRNLNLQTQISLEDAYNGKNIIANINLPSGKDQTVEVKIPPGIKDGMTLRLTGVGDDSIPNAPRGDIYLTISIFPHRTFQRENDDLRMNLPISCFDAILGKTVQIETIDGRQLETQIPPGIQPDQVLSIPGHGMPSVSNPLMKGRLLINVKIFIPTTLTEEQKESLRKVIQ